ncbi:hypothetical protein BDN67DRAFT_973701 [Paxillus ammoniavirescens]|nr:hypothetical protein BDN67DRAFT_973701 [Paxillus ammoniavirescens]
MCRRIPPPHLHLTTPLIRFVTVHRQIGARPPVSQGSPPYVTFIHLFPRCLYPRSSSLAVDTRRPSRATFFSPKFRYTRYTCTAQALSSRSLLAPSIYPVKQEPKRLCQRALGLSCDSLATYVSSCLSHNIVYPYVQGNGTPKKGVDRYCSVAAQIFKLQHQRACSRTRNILAWIKGTQSL